MQDVYTGPADTDGPQVLRWDAGKHIDDGGRPTIEVLQDMYQIAFDYSKYSSSTGLGTRQPMPPPTCSRTTTSRSRRACRPTATPTRAWRAR